MLESPAAGRSGVPAEGSHLAVCGIRRVGIAGRGRMGAMLARCFAARGLRVLSGGRRPEPPPDAVGQDHPIHHASPATVVADAAALVLALPFSAAIAMARAGRLGPGRGRLLIDATNRCFDDRAELPPGLAGRVGFQLARGAAAG